MGVQDGNGHTKPVGQLSKLPPCALGIPLRSVHLPPRALAFVDYTHSIFRDQGRLHLPFPLAQQYLPYFPQPTFWAGIGSNQSSWLHFSESHSLLKEHFNPDLSSLPDPKYSPDCILFIIPSYFLCSGLMGQFTEHVKDYTSVVFEKLYSSAESHLERKGLVPTEHLWGAKFSWPLKICLLVIRHRCAGPMHCPYPATGNRHCSWLPPTHLRQGSLSILKT